MRRHSSGSYNVRIRVLVAEGDENAFPVRAAVDQAPQLELVACVEHAAAVVARTVELAPDVLVLDEGLPGGAIAAAVEICARMPEVALVMTHGPDQDGLVEALAAGASAYVARSGHREELIQSIADVCKRRGRALRDQIPRIVDDFAARPAAASASGGAPN